MNIEELDKLEALAKAATPGPWTAQKARSVIHVGGFSKVCEISTSANHVYEDYPGAKKEFIEKQEHNAAYLEAANPATILALIERVRELESILSASFGALIRDGHDETIRRAMTALNASNKEQK